MIGERYPSGSVKMPQTACPVCSTKLDAATDPDGTDALPKVGDITICLHCAEVMEFGADMLPVRIRDETLESLSGDMLMEISQGVRLVRQFQAETKAKRA